MAHAPAAGRRGDGAAEEARAAPPRRRAEASSRRSGRLRLERLRIGDRETALLRPRSPEALIDEDAFADDEFLPYWAELWPSGVALADHLARLDLAGHSVLELGCGLGLPSLVAARSGGTVLATDWAPDALSLLERNAAANRAAVAVEQVRWDDPAALLGRRFDLVLAADVLYEERHARPLIDLLGRTVAPRGTAIVADPGRRHAEPFLELARARWQLHSAPHGLLPRGAIYTLRRHGCM